MKSSFRIIYSRFRSGDVNGHGLPNLDPAIGGNSDTKCIGLLIVICLCTRGKDYFMLQVKEPYGKSNDRGICNAGVIQRHHFLGQGKHTRHTECAVYFSIHSVEFSLLDIGAEDRTPMVHKDHWQCGRARLN